MQNILKLEKEKYKWHINQLLCLCKITNLKYRNGLHDDKKYVKKM